MIEILLWLAVAFRVWITYRWQRIYRMNHKKRNQVLDERGVIRCTDECIPIIARRYSHPPSCWDCPERVARMQQRQAQREEKAKEAFAWLKEAP